MNDEVWTDDDIETEQEPTEWDIGYNAGMDATTGVRESIELTLKNAFAWRLQEGCSFAEFREGFWSAIYDEL